MRYDPRECKITRIIFMTRQKQDGARSHSVIFIYRKFIKRCHLTISINRASRNVRVQIHNI
jgi:hypothetical protein